MVDTQLLRSLLTGELEDLQNDERSEESMGTLRKESTGRSAMAHCSEALLSSKIICSSLRASQQHGKEALLRECVRIASTLEGNPVMSFNRTSLAARVYARPGTHLLQVLKCESLLNLHVESVPVRHSDRVNTRWVGTGNGRGFPDAPLMV